MDFILILVSISVLFILLVYGGYKIVSEDVESIQKGIKVQWIKRAAKHLVKEGNVTKDWALGYAETLYDECLYDFYGIDNWLDEPEAVVEEDVSNWEG